ncbi:Phage replication protein CRI [Beggiatoa alba B18LD]|uniref:Phage replication protein CRI n=1 Tax=Beggiatoa alba B18LD TaxID=395493 RepID=I3CK72_9GAMM|nr:phage/plasmid replication protein [Beggiatoa alba]EIJ44015.1 Phage replication protein CRI [Beggiatoa alba B18LD]
MMMQTQESLKLTPIQFQPFCDWVTISQRHGLNSVKVINSGMVVYLDSDGNIEYYTEKHQVHEGSYDTRLMIRSDGCTVSVSGNVGVFGRHDNVFNYSFVDTIKKLNDLLVNDFELPPFTAGEDYFRQVRYRRSKELHLLRVWTGATLSRIDLTQNFALGSPELAEEYLHYLASLKPTRMRTQINGSSDTIETVNYGLTSKYRSGVVYNKAIEFAKRKVNELKRKEPYYLNLLNYLTDNGVLRYELRLRQRYLTQSGLRYLGAIMEYPKELDKVFTESASVVIRDTSLSSVNQLSRPAWLTYLRWTHGAKLPSNRTFYRHRSEILRTVGVDVASPYTPQSMDYARRHELSIKPAVIPSGYFLPRLEG